MIENPDDSTESATITGQKWGSVWDALDPTNSVEAQLDAPPVADDPFPGGDQS